MAYENANSQLDRYARLLPPTDDPQQVLEYLLPMWKSYRESEAKMCGTLPLSSEVIEDKVFARDVEGHVREVELDGIYALLDALTGVELPQTWQGSIDFLESGGMGTA